MDKKEDEKKTEEQPKGFESRDNIMDAIIESRNHEFEQETNEKTEEEKPTEPDEKEKDSDETTVIDVDKKDDGITIPEKLTTGDEKDRYDEDVFELIVDGEKQAMEKADVIALAQKNLAADKRLQESEQKLKKAEQLLEEAKENKSSLSELNDATTIEAIEKNVSKKRTAYLHAMNYGEPEEQEEAMIAYEQAVYEQAVGSATQFSENTKDLAATIKAEIKEELTGEQIRDRFALPESQGGFGDILDDEDLRDICFARIDKAIANGANHADWKTYADVAEKVRDRFITKIPRQPDKTLQDKKERKKTIDNLETVSDTTKSTVASKTPVSSKQSRSETIADMAKSRPGQQIY